MSGGLFARALVLALPCAAIAQIANIEITVVEGSGAVRAAGSVTARPLVVAVADEFGKPVAGAAVSFRLPEDGPGGVFAGGLRADIGITDAAGRAAARNIRWNAIPGRFLIRITAAKEQAHAGTVSPQYIAGPARASTQVRPRRRSRKWVVIAAVAAAAVGGGIAAGSGGSSASARTAPAPAPVPVIGAPVITVGKP